MEEHSERHEHTPEDRLEVQQPSGAGAAGVLDWRGGGGFAGAGEGGRGGGDHGGGGGGSGPPSDGVEGVVDAGGGVQRCIGLFG